MSVVIYVEHALATAGAALMPVVDENTARPYVLNGAVLVARDVTVTPSRDSGTARYEYGPWRRVHVAGELRVVA